MRLLSLFLLSALVVPLPTCFAQQSSHEDFQEFCKSIEGRAVGSTTLVQDSPFGKKGDKVTTHFSSYMAADGHMLIGTYQAGQGAATWILSYHPGAKQIKVQFANSGGNYAEGTIAKENGKWTERTKGAKADGSSTTAVKVLTTSDDGETHTWKGSGTVDGKAIDDWETVWKRVFKQ
jgi:hypothetical protein